MVGQLDQVVFIDAVVVTVTLHGVDSTQENISRIFEFRMSGKIDFFK